MAYKRSVLPDDFVAGYYSAIMDLEGMKYTGDSAYSRCARFLRESAPNGGGEAVHTIASAARLIKVSRRTFERYVAEGRIEATLVDGRQRFAEADLARLRDSRPKRGRPKAAPDPAPIAHISYLKYLP